jgi:hypothetical protein
MGENREGSCSVLEEKGDGVAVLRVEDCEEMGEDRLRVEREMEPRLEGCGDCLGFSQGEGTCFGWLGEEDGGKRCGGSEREFKSGEKKGEVCCGFKRKNQNRVGGGCLESDRFKFRFRVRFFCVFPQYVKLPPLCVLYRLVFIGKNIARFSNLVPQLLSFFVNLIFLIFF